MQWKKYVLMDKCAHTTASLRKLTRTLSDDWFYHLHTTTMHFHRFFLHGTYSPEVFLVHKWMQLILQNATLIKTIWEQSIHLGEKHKSRKTDKGRQKCTFPSGKFPTDFWGWLTRCTFMHRGKCSGYEIDRKSHTTQHMCAYQRTLGNFLCHHHNGLNGV